LSESDVHMPTLGSRTPGGASALSASGLKLPNAQIFSSFQEPTTAFLSDISVTAHQKCQNLLKVKRLHRPALPHIDTGA